MVPIQFEYVDVLRGYDIPPKVNKFVVILGAFKHHYCDEVMYRIRADYVHPMTGNPISEHTTVSKSDILKMLKTQVTDE